MEYPDNKHDFTTKEFLEAMRTLETEMFRAKEFRIICHPDDKEFVESLLRGEL
jgi:hypothetical protein